MTLRGTLRLLAYLILVAAWASFTASAFAQTATTQSNASALNPSGNSACLTCHGQVPVDGSIEVNGQKVPATVDVNGQQKSIYVDEHHMADSPHGQLACVSCHIGFKADMHTDSVTNDWLTTAKLSACANCHSDVTQTYDSSIHGQLAAEDPSSNAPLCGDCHNAHNIVSPGTAEFHTAELAMCQRCHPNAAETYKDSYHGKAYLLGSGKTAVCSDCHTGHGILPASDPKSSVSQQNLVATCRTCHPEANKNFAGFKVHVNPQSPRSSWEIWIFWMAYVLLIAVVFSFAAVHTGLYVYRGYRDGLYSRSHHPARARRGAKRIEYQRFNVFHRWMHFLVIVSFTVLVFTGMPLKYKNTPWAHWFMDLVGGVSAAGVYHRIAAIITVVYWTAEMLYMITQVARKRGRNLRGPDSMLPRTKDLQDMIGMFSWFFGRGPKPQFDRWAYWEKFDYLSLGVGTVIIGATGFMMWFPLKTTQYVPGIFLNIALVIHSNEALLAMGVIFIFVHFFSAHLRPESFPIDKVIFTGSLPVEHYREDRPLEYARHLREGTLDDVLVERTITRKTMLSDGLWWIITGVMGCAALLMTAFIIWSLFV